MCERCVYIAHYSDLNNPMTTVLPKLIIITNQVFMAFTVIEL